MANHEMVRMLPDYSWAGIVIVRGRAMARAWGFSRPTAAEVTAAWTQSRRDFRPLAEVEGEIAKRLADLRAWDALRAEIAATGVEWNEAGAEAARRLGQSHAA